MKKSKKLSERVEKRKSSLKELQKEWSGDPRQHGEREIASARADEEIFPYLDEFISEIRAMAPLPKSDLTTPEGARAAVHILADKLAELERYQKTAQALKSLLLNKASDDSVQ